MGLLRFIKIRELRAFAITNSRRCCKAFLAQGLAAAPGEHRAFYVNLKVAVDSSTLGDKVRVIRRI